MEDKQKIQEIRTQRTNNNKKILKLKQQICELENSNYNHNSKNNRKGYFAYSMVMFLGAILGEIAGGIIGYMGNNILLGLFLAFPFAIIPAFGAVYGFIKAIKLKKVKSERVNDNSQLEQELNLKYEELEMLEQLDHELYTQLRNELSKIPTEFVERSVKDTIISHGTHTLDDNIAGL